MLAKDRVEGIRSRVVLQNLDCVDLLRRRHIGAFYLWLFRCVVLGVEDLRARFYLAAIRVLVANAVTGVPLRQLRCLTCGVIRKRLSLRQALEDLLAGFRDEIFGSGRLPCHHVVALPHDSR